MSGFNTDDVRRLAALAQLQLTGEEATAFARQLSDILAFATEVQAVDVDALTPANTTPGAMLSPEAPSREDSLEPSLDRDVVLAAAPAADPQAGVFKVPRVLNG